MPLKKLFLLGLTLLTFPLSGFAQRPQTINQAVDSLVQQIRASFVEKSGKVAAVQGNEVYLNIGLTQRVREGDEFEVVRYGQELKDAQGNSLGFTETYLGKIRVSKVRGAKLSIAEVVEQKLPFQAGDGALSVARKVRVAMSEFSGTNLETTSFVRVVPEILAVALAMTGEFEVAERSRLQQILQELEFSQSGLSDPKTSQQIGKLLGVEGIVLGSVSELEDSVDLSIKLIDTETGLVFGAARSQIQKSVIVQEMLKRRDQTTIRGELSLREAKLVEQFQQDFGLLQDPANYVELGRVKMWNSREIGNQECRANLFSDDAYGCVPIRLNAALAVMPSESENYLHYRYSSSSGQTQYVYLVSRNMLVKKIQKGSKAYYHNYAGGFLTTLPSGERGVVYWQPNNLTPGGDVFQNTPPLGLKLAKGELVGFAVSLDKTGIADFNSDGRPDIPTYGDNKGRGQLRIGNWASDTVYGGKFKVKFGFGDLNGNSIPEIFLNLNTDQGGFVRMIEWDKQTYVEKWTSRRLGDYVNNITVGDVNNDGVDELLIEVYEKASDGKSYDAYIYFVGVR